MLPLTPTSRRYPWGSPTAIPHALGMSSDGSALAEAWFGAHPSGSAIIELDEGATTLEADIAADPVRTLGADVVARFGPQLPYLLKLIAADSPLSLQVHPDVAGARAGFAAEEASGTPIDAPSRSYRDTRHKPELLYALTTFEALVGFRAPRRAAELFDGLDAPLAREVRAMLAAEPGAHGIRTVFEHLLSPATRPGSAAVTGVVDACTARLWDGSPSPRADRRVLSLAEYFPGDPAVVASLLLNPVTLTPGDAVFVPARTVHAHLSGLAVEIMANSDNELRGGLTAKHVDVPALLSTVDYTAAPPLRIAPEVFFGSTRVYYAPVDDFELSVTTLDDDAVHPLPGRGPRVVLCLDGEATVSAADGTSLALGRGGACFVPATDGALTVRGRGTVVQADVP
ncbi:MAG: mannose-6-phosphate isomerase, class I [Cellulomonadaceae bacterium]|nr:mannose-6-phosphate isomerase, class I [Cellulomonadaceae bacterium]